MLGGSIVDANLLPWAQLAWGAGGGQKDTAAAASLVQRLDWQEMAVTLPGMQSQHLFSRAVSMALDMSRSLSLSCRVLMRTCIYDQMLRDSCLHAKVQYMLPNVAVSLLHDLYSYSVCYCWLS